VLQRILKEKIKVFRASVGIDGENTDKPFGGELYDNPSFQELP
jgi:hypothetical protein